MFVVILHCFFLSHLPPLFPSHFFSSFSFDFPGLGSRVVSLFHGCAWDGSAVNVAVPLRLSLVCGSLELQSSVRVCA